MIMISVIIPLYNKAHTIVNTLNTVFNQTYQNFEVIIVNDGSTDNGVEVIKQNFNDSRIRIISQSNAGVSAARNKGVDESRGEWVSFLDGDDEWHPDYLSIVSNAISQYPEVGMICTGGLYGNVKNPSKVGYRMASKYTNKITIVNFFENPCVFSQTSGLSVKKSIFKKTQGFPLGMKCCEDYACTQAIALITKTLYIGLPISKYNGGVEGQITSLDAETKFKYLKYVVDYYNLVMNDYLINQSTNKVFKIYFKYDIRHRIKDFIISNDKRGLNFFLTNLSNEVLNLFSSYEISLYKEQRALSLLWINFTKLIWMTHGYPIVGENISINKLQNKYRKW